MVITSETLPECAVIHLSGRLDTLTSPDLQTTVVSMINSGEVKVVIDFSEVDYISSAGLRVLIIAQKMVTPKGGSVVLQGVSAALNELFSISGFLHLFCFTDSINESRNYFSGSVGE